jgi:histidinol-phosphate aminotransferase
MKLMDSMDRRDWLKSSGAALAALACSSKLSGSTAPVAEAAPQLARPVQLSLNENPLGPSPAAIQAMQAHVTAVPRYPVAESRALLKTLAEKEGVPSEQILLGAGSGEVLEAYGAHLGGAGGEVITAWPSYRQLAGAMERRGSTVVEVPLTSTKVHDLDAMAAAITPRTQCVYICNPNNPTGTKVNADKLREFAIEVSKQVPVFIDEAYLECTDNFAAETMVGLVAAGHNVTVSRTFSKIYAMAGQRIGYAVVPEHLTKPVRTQITGGTNLLALVGAEASLADTAYLETTRQAIKAGRETLIAVLEDLGCPYAEPHGNFVFFQSGVPITEFRPAMQAAGARVGRHFPPYDDWCRISIGTPAEMAVAHTALREVIAQLR